MTRRRMVPAGAAAIEARAGRAVAVPAGAGRALQGSGLWPLPALVAWTLGWAVLALLSAAGAPVLVAAAGGTLGAGALTLWGRTRMRRLVMALGFPVSLLAAQGSGALPWLSAAGWTTPALPAWAWLLPLALLALAYPVSAWRDAPLFPTPDGALDGLALQAPLPPGARIVDAGCGLGHGLAALRRAYPQARLRGIERSRLIAWAAALRCRRAPIQARVHAGDMWADDWRGCAMVYLFQRPESLPRAVEKARHELDPGAWLASLEFPALALTPQAVLHGPEGRTVWLYQAPFRPARAGQRPAAFFTTQAPGAGESPSPLRARSR